MIINETNYVQGSAEWLNYRKNIITATDVGAILGVSPFKDYFDLILSKWFNQPTSKNKKMEWGSECESVARDFFKKKYKKEVNEVNLCIHPTFDWLGASPDGVLPDENAIIEIKCPYDKIFDGIPDNYYCQIQIQLEVLKVNFCYFWVCLCKRGFRPNNLYYCEEKDISVIEYRREIVYYKSSFIKKHFEKIHEFYQNYIFNKSSILNQFIINYHIPPYFNETKTFHFNNLLAIKAGEEIIPWFDFHSHFKKDIIMKRNFNASSPTNIFFNEKKNKLYHLYLNQLKKTIPNYQTIHFNNQPLKIILHLSKPSLHSLILLKPTFILNGIKVSVDFGLRCENNNEYRFVWLSLGGNLVRDVRKDKWLMMRMFVEVSVGRLGLPVPYVCRYYLSNGLEEREIVYDNELEEEACRLKLNELLERWMEIRSMSNIEMCEMNMKYKDNWDELNEIRESIAYDRGELTLLWGITNNRKGQFIMDESIKSFWSSKFEISKTIKKEKRKKNIIIKMVENEKNSKIPKKPNLRYKLIKKKSNVNREFNLEGRYYVDFETVEMDGVVYVFQVGVGYLVGGEFRYKSFITLRNVVKNERGLLKRWLKWMGDMEGVRLVHWSGAESIIYGKLMKRYSFLPDLGDKWEDLLLKFREKYLELEVKGLFNFSLKSVASVLSRYGYIVSNYDGCVIKSGFDALVQAQLYFRKNNGLYKNKMREFKEEIEKYNELDVKILMEIDKIM